MKHRSTSTTRTEKGCAGFHFLTALTIVGIIFGGAWVCAKHEVKKDEKKFDERCQPLAEAIHDLSKMRDDGFVVDSHNLHAFSKSDLPMWLWSKRLIEESNLKESEDYVIMVLNGRKRPLLTIEAVWEITVKTTEGGGRFPGRTSWTDARDLLRCLQEPYFPEVTGDTR